MRPSRDNAPGENNQYDIFKEEPDRKLLWMEVVTGLEEAKNRSMSLASTNPARYRIYDSAKAKFIDLSNKKSA